MYPWDFFRVSFSCFYHQHDSCHMSNGVLGDESNVSAQAEFD